ncbi:MAG: DegT/DnrJ/EryC1/StrS family aminotransferase [Bryobacteraceae bacterium]|nr:DegT/DnrJ/EryC1/StrS family aminotransferase [Bryobacteraceae bacterium]
MQRVLLSVPHMGGMEESYVGEAFETNWLSTVGPNIEGFEREMEERVGWGCVALGSGTAGIHLGLRLLGVGVGDEVLCSTLTFVASVNPARYLGAEAVLVDSERASWNLDPGILEEGLRARAAAGRLPKAAVVVDLFGQCADMDAVMGVCRRWGVAVLEDAAEAVGGVYWGGRGQTALSTAASPSGQRSQSPVRHAGTLADVGVYSFNGNKMITTTGGGMLLSGRRDWVEKARWWSQQARDAGVGYEHSEVGHNYRMSTVRAGIGRGQLQVLDERVRQRRGIAFRYREAFADLDGIELMPQAGWGLHTNWLSVFLVDARRFGCTRDELMRVLDRAGVETRPVWKPMHLQKLYERSERWGGGVAEDLWRRGICLPSSSSLTEEEQLRVVNGVRGAVGAGALRDLGMVAA